MWRMIGGFFTEVYVCTQQYAIYADNSSEICDVWWCSKLYDFKVSAREISIRLWKECWATIMSIMNIVIIRGYATYGRFKKEFKKINRKLQNDLSATTWIYWKLTQYMLCSNFYWEDRFHAKKPASINEFLVRRRKSFTPFSSFFRT